MTSMHEHKSLPVIDMAALFGSDAAQRGQVATAIQRACRQYGFFYVRGHGVESQCLDELDVASRRFFTLPADTKMKIAMAKGGVAWRGFFPVGGELTSGKPDIKEGLYFGSELSSEHPRVAAGWPLHGANLWPEEVPELKDCRDRLYGFGGEGRGSVLLEGIGAQSRPGGGLFRGQLHGRSNGPLPDFPLSATCRRSGSKPCLGCGRAYGLRSAYACWPRTVTADSRSKPRTAGSKRRRSKVRSYATSAICLDRLTGGWFRSTPHRVQNVSGCDADYLFRCSSIRTFAAEMKPLPEQASRPAATIGEARWDGADLQAFEGTYGDYLISKVSKVFPELSRKVL